MTHPIRQALEALEEANSVCSSVSMPDHLVEIAGWLNGIGTSATKEG